MGSKESSGHAAVNVHTIVWPGEQASWPMADRVASVGGVDSGASLRRVSRLTAHTNRIISPCSISMSSVVLCHTASVALLLTPTGGATARRADSPSKASHRALLCCPHEAAIRDQSIFMPATTTGCSPNATPAWAAWAAPHDEATADASATRLTCSSRPRPPGCGGGAARRPSPQSRF